MKFACDVSNRVFYMDEGGIYEEGTPDEIFGAPKKERTRVFIKRLKQLPLVLETADFDFIGCISQLETSSRNNSLSEKTVKNMMLIFEEAVKQGIAARDGVYPVNIMAEISETDESVTLEAVYGGNKFDPISDGDEISASIIKNASADIVFGCENGVNTFKSVIRNDK